MSQLIEVPFHSQLDNEADSDSGWWNECSYSSMAMLLAAIGMVGDGRANLDDYIELEYEKAGYKRGAPFDMNVYMDGVAQKFGKSAKFTRRGSRGELRSLLDRDIPTIIHTFLTRSGHILVCRGYDDESYGGRGGWIVNDPYGEWFSWGYDTTVTGEGLDYSYIGAGSYFGQDGDMWIHWIE